MARHVKRVAFVSSCLAALLSGKAFAQAEVKSDGTATSDHAEHALSSDASPRDRALDLFERSAVLYQRHDFRGAVGLLKEAYGLFPEPVLLYNLARAYERLDEKTEAADAYASYLAAEPTTPDRAALERRVLALRAQVLEQTRASQRESPAAQTKASASLAAPLVIGGIGIAGLGIGTVLYAVGQSRHRDASRQPDAATAQTLQRRAEDLVLGANIGFVGGAVLTAAGAAWAIVVLTAPPETPRSATVELRLTAGSASIAGRF